MYVICTYDVNEKHCAKVMKVLRKYLFHYQNSVFEGELTPKQFENVRNELNFVIGKDDSIMFYYTHNNKLVNKKEMNGQPRKRNIIE